MSVPASEHVAWGGPTCKTKAEDVETPLHEGMDKNVKTTVWV